MCTWPIDVSGSGLISGVHSLELCIRLKSFLLDLNLLRRDLQWSENSLLLFKVNGYSAMPPPVIKEYSRMKGEVKALYVEYRIHFYR